MIADRTSSMPRPVLPLARNTSAGVMARSCSMARDVNNNPENPVINTRSFGEAPGLVAEFTKAFIEGAQAAGAMACAKHFPGHGDTATDSHIGLPVVDVSRDRLEKLELVPFRAAIEIGRAS